MDANNEFLDQKDEKEKETKKKTRTKKAGIEEVKKDDIPLSVAEEVHANEIVVFEHIDNALIEKNITEETLKAMEEEFMVLKVNGVDDKENYKIIDEKRKMCKKTRGLTKDICEGGRADLIAQQKAWIKKEKEIISRIQTVEDYLDSQLKIVDDEKQRIKEEKEKADQIRLSERTGKMLSFGMQLQGDNYVLGSHVINVLHVKMYDEFTFGEALAPVEAEYKRQLEIKAEEDARLKELQEQQDKEREQLRKEKEAFEEQQRQAAKAEEERQAKIKAEQDKLEADKKALAEAKIKARTSQLYAQGMSFNGTDHVFGAYVVPGELIKTLSDTDWEQKVTNEILPALAERKAKIEDERLAKIEKDKQDAIEADRKKRAEEDVAKAKAEADAKAKETAEKEAALKEEARLAALRPDEEKYQEFKKNFEGIAEPDYSTEEYKKFSIECKEVIRKMIVHFEKQKPK